MEYNKFVQSAFEKIKSAREGSLSCKLQTQYAKLNEHFQNAYIQLIAKKNKKQTKIQQWSFITLKSLQQSEYGESYDPELDSIEVEKKSFFTHLEQNLMEFCPKLLIKVLEPDSVWLIIKTEKEKLLPFLEDSNYVIDIGEYEGSNFSTKIYLKVLHHQNNPSSGDFGKMDEEQEFEVLIDPQFQSQRTKNNVHSSHKNKSKNIKISQKHIDDNFVEYQSPIKLNKGKSILKVSKQQSINKYKIEQKQGNINQNQIIEASTKYVYVSTVQDASSKKRDYIEELKNQLHELHLEGLTFRELFDII